MGVLWAGALLVLLVLLIAKLWDLKALDKTDFRFDLEEKRVRVGDRFQMSARIRNEKLLPLPIIRIRYELPADLTESGMPEAYHVTTSLLPYEAVKKTVTFPARKRGYYLFVDTGLVLRDLFGIFQKELTLDKNLALIIQPRVRPLSDLLMVSNSYQGEKLVRRWLMPDPILYSGVRPYTGSDGFRDIDWVATAKLQELHVKKYDYTADPSLMMFLDVSAFNSQVNVDEDYVERAVELAASVAAACGAAGVPVGIRSNCYYKHMADTGLRITSPDRTAGHVEAILDMLACVTSMRKEPLEDMLLKHERQYLESSTFFVIARDIYPALQAAIGRVLSHGGRVVLATPDENVSFAGHPALTVIPMRKGGDSHAEME